MKKNSLLHMETIKTMMKNNGFKDAVIYKDLLSCFEGTPYILGEETPASSDCSGSVCCTLNVLYNKNIRVTADDLYKKYFTETDTGDDAICALFFIDRTGVAVHVAGRMADDFFMNVSSMEPKKCGTIREFCEFKELYPSRWRTELRSLRQGAWK